MSGGMTTLAAGLARAVAQESWMDDGLCARGYDPDRGAFAEERTDGATSGRIMAFKLLCGRCPVRAECMAYGNADKHSREWGIYGGLTPPERARVGYDVEAGLMLHASQVAKRLPRQLASEDVLEDYARYLRAVDAA